MNKIFKDMIIAHHKHVIVYNFTFLLVVFCKFYLFTDQVRWAIGDGRLNISPEGLIITP
ncbi:hypothetical protein NARC_110151, partial [Candidatus Nitrosocosmicus arcticus]